VEEHVNIRRTAEEGSQFSILTIWSPTSQFDELDDLNFEVFLGFVSNEEEGHVEEWKCRSMEAIESKVVKQFTEVAVANLETCVLCSQYTDDQH